jgi:hypothetical protein
MPLWLRRTTFNIIKEFYENEAEEAEKQQKTLKNGSSKGEVARPNISRPNPTYTTKAAKK